MSLWTQGFLVGTCIVASYFMGCAIGVLRRIATALEKRDSE